MANQEEIRTILERNVQAVSLRPSLGQGTAKTRVTAGRTFFRSSIGRSLRGLSHVFSARHGRTGFAAVDVSRLPTVRHYGSADEAHAEYLQSIAACRQDARYAVPGEFVVARGIRLPL